MAKPLLSLAAAAARLLPAPLKRALYRMGPLSRALRAGLNQAAPEGMTEVRVAGGPLQGLKLLLNLHTEKDYWLGTYEMDLQQAAADWIQPGMVIYDLGANIGYFSLLAGRAAGEGRVYAFEALPTNLERLRTHIAINPGLAAIEAIARAVAAQSGRAHFRVHASGAMGKLNTAAGRQEAYVDEIEVEAIALDDFVFGEGRTPPDLIKMDIEGGEGPALQGMARLLTEIRPILLIELHGPEAAHAVWGQLTQAGYSLHRMAKGYLRVDQVSQLDWKSYVLGVPGDA